MKDFKKLERNLNNISRLLLLILMMTGMVAAMLIYYTIDPGLSAFRRTDSTQISLPSDPNRVEDGVHTRTGLVDAEGLMTVVNNCTNCHSAKLVMQNRMNRERWVSTIRWMQETQNLWDLGDQEEVIINYLTTNYPVMKHGRRKNLEEIEWYALED